MIAFAFSSPSLSLSASLSPPLMQKNSHFTHTHTHTFSALFFSFNTNIIYRSTRPLRSLSFFHTYLTLVEHLSVYNYRFARPLCRLSCDSIYIYDELTSSSCSFIHLLQSMLAHIIYN